MAWLKRPLYDAIWRAYPGSDANSMVAWEDNCWLRDGRVRRGVSQAGDPSTLRRGGDRGAQPRPALATERLRCCIPGAEGLAASAHATKTSAVGGYAEKNF